MKTYKVIRGFFDKNTKAFHKIGTEYKCDDKRFEEIQKQGNFLTEVKAEPEAEPEKEKKTTSKKKA